MGSETLKRLQGFIAVGSEAPFLDPNKVVIVGLDEPETNENWYAHCPRLRDESDADLALYVAEILAYGVIERAAQVCRDGDRLVLLDGRRTTRSARLAWAQQARRGVPAAERVKIRCIIHKGDPDSWYRVNNNSHKAKALTPLQHARGFLALYQRFGEDHTRVAELQGCTVQTVKNQLRIFDLSDKGQKLLNTGTPLTALTKLADLPRAEQDKKFEEMEAAGATNGAAAHNAAHQVKRGEPVVHDKTKMRSRLFLERWAKELGKVDAKHREIDPVALIRFVLGGAPPRGLDEQVKESLAEAGWKAKEK